MTTPPPPPPPSGYGGPPYGGPPQPPPPGSPYGAPGAPQPPYGSQPPGPPGGWGGPPPQGPQGPQPGGNNKGKLIAIIGACVVVIALAITLTFALGGSSDGDAEADASNSQETPQSDASDDPDDASGEPDDDASDDATDDDEADDGTEKLSLPQTLLGGDYKLLQDMSEQFDREAPRGQDITGLGGSFQATSGEDTLVVAAYDGNIGNPTIAKRDFLQGTGSGANAKITVQPKDFDVDDADSPVRCQVVTQTQGNMEVPLPTCVWADGDTLISAIHTDPGQVNGNAQSIKLDTHAERLMDILDDFGGDT